MHLSEPRAAGGRRFIWISAFALALWLFLVNASAAIAGGDHPSQGWDSPGDHNTSGWTHDSEGTPTSWDHPSDQGQPPPEGSGSGQPCEHPGTPPEETPPVTPPETTPPPETHLRRRRHRRRRTHLRRKRRLRRCIRRRRRRLRRSRLLRRRRLRRRPLRRRRHRLRRRRLRCTHLRRRRLRRRPQQQPSSPNETPKHHTQPGGTRARAGRVKRWRWGRRDRGAEHGVDAALHGRRHPAARPRGRGVPGPRTRPTSGECRAGLSPGSPEATSSEQRATPPRGGVALAFQAPARA